LNSLSFYAVADGTDRLWGLDKVHCKNNIIYVLVYKARCTAPEVLCFTAFLQPSFSIFLATLAATLAHGAEVKGPDHVVIVRNVEFNRPAAEFWKK
jgi:hypothetical protein